jgi:hypothetical protein
MAPEGGWDDDHVVDVCIVSQQFNGPHPSDEFAFTGGHWRARYAPRRFVVKNAVPAFLVFALVSSAGCSGSPDAAPPARPTPAAPAPVLPATAAPDAGNAPLSDALHIAGGKDACAAWLSSNPPLQRYLALPVLAREADAPGAAQHGKRGRAQGLSEEELLAGAFHRVLLAFVARDAPALAAELPELGQLTVVNTMEDLVGSRDLPLLTKELRARKGKQFENMMAGEDDDYADRFSVRATLPWCRNGRNFFILGVDPSDVTFLRFSAGAIPKLLAFGTAGL